MRQMFGEQGGRVAKILAQQGVEGLTQALADMDEQADKTMRITEKTSTLSAAFEQLEGVATLLSGTIGETLRDSLLWLSNNLQDFIENTLQPFVNNNKELVKWLMVGAAGLIALAAVGGTLLLVFAGLNAMWVMGRFAIGGLLANLGLLGRLFTSFAGFAAVAGKAALSGLATAVMWLGRAFLIAGRFMLANPIVLVIAAVVAAGRRDRANRPALVRGHHGADRASTPPLARSAVAPHWPQWPAPAIAAPPTPSGSGQP